MTAFKRLIGSTWLELALRVILGGILIYAGSLKIVDMPAMADSVLNYRLLPEEYANLVAMILPPLEILIGLCLILGFMFQGALLSATAVYGMFWIAIAWAASQGYDIDCGCFGTAASMKVGLLALLRNTLFLAGLVPLWLKPEGAWRLDSIWKRPSQAAPAEAAETA